MLQAIVFAIILLFSHSDAFTGSQRKTKLNSIRTKFQSNVKLPAFPQLQSHSSVTLKAIPGCLFSCIDTKSKLAGLVAIAGVLLILIQRALWVPSRTYNKEKNTVGNEYDNWTEEGILEYYWGEHIHLGYYNDEERAAGYKKKNFIEAKYDFVDRMMEFGEVDKMVKPARILDVGCGIGGTSRYIAKKFGESTKVTGITLSQKQVDRASQLAKERGISNAEFQVMDALAMTFPDNSFDVVWGCESGEHMPDKERYVAEMMRVLKPGGRLVIATWCQRDDETRPFDAEERKTLDFLYSEWTHPFFISIKKYAQIMSDLKVLTSIRTADWNVQTLPSWRHSIWVGVFDPWPVVSRPHLWWKTLRDGITLERMHKAFDNGLMQYGMFTATKLKPYVPPK